MTRSELIELMASQQNQLTTKDVELAVKLMIDHMAESLASGERIEIRGFGSFYSKTYDAREGRNPRTGQAIDVPEKTHVLFRVGKELKGRVDANNDDSDQ